MERKPEVVMTSHNGCVGGAAQTDRRLTSKYREKSQLGAVLAILGCHVSIGLRSSA